MLASALATGLPSSGATRPAALQQGHAAPQELRYKPAQYRSPCSPMNPAGGVCPRMLDCAVLDASTNASVYRDARAPACFVRRMPGLAFNPAVVKAPAWLVTAAAAAGLPGTVVYAATHRVGFMNHGSCDNDATTQGGKKFEVDGSELLLLGAGFEVLLTVSRPTPP